LREQRTGQVGLELGGAVLAVTRRLDGATEKEIKVTLTSSFGSVEISRGKAEKIITAHAGLAIFLARHLPRLVRLLLHRGRPYRTAPSDDG
jgi:hypothetical protein